MRSPSRLSLFCVPLACVAVACSDDTVHGDLFADANDPSFAAGTSVSTAVGSGDAPGASKEDEDVAAGGGASSETGSSSDGPSGDGPPAGETPNGGIGGGGTPSDEPPSDAPPSDDPPSGGPIGDPSGAAPDLSAYVRLCGKLHAFTAAGVQAGALSIAGITLPIAKGTTITGQLLATLGANVCLDAKLDSAGRVHASASLSLDLGLGTRARAKACGKVTAYVAASASTKGGVAIGGASFDIAAGAQIDAKTALAVDASVCIDASLGPSGVIASGVVTAF